MSNNHSFPNSSSSPLDGYRWIGSEVTIRDTQFDAEQLHACVTNWVRDEKVDEYLKQRHAVGSYLINPSTVAANMCREVCIFTQYIIYFVGRIFKTNRLPMFYSALYI